MKRKYLITSDPTNPKWICQACYPAMLEIGFAGRHCIVYNKNHSHTNHGNIPYSNGKYAILDGQGHGEDEYTFFLKKPIWDKNKDDPIEIIDLKVYPNDGYDDILYSIEHYGYDRKKDGFYSYWVLNNVSSLLKAWERKFGQTVEDYYGPFAEKQMKIRNEKYKINT